MKANNQTIDCPFCGESMAKIKKIDQEKRIISIECNNCGEFEVGKDALTEFLKHRNNIPRKQINDIIKNIAKCNESNSCPNITDNLRTLIINCCYMKTLPVR